MIIDTRTKDSIENSLAKYLNISVSELNSYVLHASKKKILSIVSSLNPHETIDEMYVYHLSRRLISDDMNNSSDNLKVLLTNKSPLSTFLKKYGITFFEQDGHIEILYNGKIVDLSNKYEPKMSYLRLRLGYIAGIKDYCFNGFALKDQLMKNDYTKRLYRCPEFIGNLATYLNNKSIITDYFKQSIYRCYTYKLRLSDILFDTTVKLSTNKEKVDFFIVKLFDRLREYTGDIRYISDSGNPAIRIDDNSRVSSDLLVEREEITNDMIK